MPNITKILARIDQIKRNTAKNLQDPLGAIGLGLLRADEDFKQDPVNTVLGSANIGGGLLGMTKAVAPEARMIVQHNLTPEKLVGVDRLGGLPVPSLAISRAGSPLENFGDITLIGRPEMARPSASNPVYRSDAYTKRRPNIEIDLDKKSQKNLAKAIGVDEYRVRDISQRLNNPYDLRYETPMQELFLKNEGLLPDKSTMKSWDYVRDVSDMALANNKFDDFLSNFVSNLDRIGVNPKEKIFKGFTYDGGRRYAPATLENIVKAMKGGAGDEGFNYGLGTVRSVAQPKFRNFQQVLDSRNQILSSSDFEPIKKQLSDEFQNVYGLLSDAGRYSPSDAMMIAAETKNPMALNRLYPNLPADSYEAAVSLLKKLQDPKLPTEYFEIKPQRAMSLSEFSGAIVPGNIDDRTVDILRRGGIKDISFYDQLDPNSRKSMFERFNPQMFSVAPAGLLGAYGMDNE